MLLENSAEIMNRLKPSDVVLDIGGWAHPFNRANYVLDSQPFETRGFYNRTFARFHALPAIGGDTEYFTKDTWIQRDICEKTPFPFRDREIDFVVCSHTLEDVRDPLFVCAEMIRVAKAGYIEVPSRIWESCRGIEPGITGLSHHRWLIDIEGSSIRFTQKYHRIHNRRYSLPASALRRLSPAESVQWLYWEGSFDYSEISLYGQAEQLQELENFVNRVRPYSRAFIAVDDVTSAVSELYSRARSKAWRLLCQAAGRSLPR
ncbi:MAG TPA: methyltransferase domain-containing protein [Bryobacteraceae bacterium]|nr:methyltransferase domain-containing protein [Bryobacteraceae bacterium]